MRRILITAWLLFGWIVNAPALEDAAGQASLSVRPIALPEAGDGIGFDDLVFSPRLGKVIVPGGRSGNLYLIDSATRKITAIHGFSSGKEYKEGHGEGITSADEGKGLIFVADRTAGTLSAVDPVCEKIIATTPLAGSPDYVRYILATDEIWVTQPNEQRIEIFSLSKGEPLQLTHADFIPVEGGPESLVYDGRRTRVYTHLWEGQSAVIDVKERKVIATWPNGCEGSRGIGIDEALGFLFAACAEGKATTLDVDHDGKILGNVEAGSGVDIIGYDAVLKRLYLPGAKSAKTAIVQVSPAGDLKLLQEVPTEMRAHCAVADGTGQVWVCDPDNGRLLLLKDIFP